MGRPKMKKSERLLRQIERSDGLTTEEMVKFLRRCDGKKYNPRRDRRAYGSILYGTSKQNGVLTTFCKCWPDGTYTVVNDVKAPFLRAKTLQTLPESLEDEYGKELGI